MLNLLNSIIPLLKSLGGVLKNALLSLFIFRQGQSKEVQEEQKKQVKDAKKANKSKSNLSTLPDSKLDSVLRKSKKSKS